MKTLLGQVIVCGIYLAVLLLFSARPAWFDWIVRESKRRARELRGMLSL